MKISLTETQLRKIIKAALIQETVSPTARAAAAGMAVCHIARTAIIYDPKRLVSAIKSIKAPWSISNAIEMTLVDDDGLDEKDPVVKAGVAYHVGDTSGQCNGAGIVAASVSWPGSKMGPAAYEAAMWYAGALASDREETSRDAGLVWLNYQKRLDAGEIDGLPFDDIDDPQTQPKEDDCTMQDRDWLNSSYSLSKKPDGLKEMETRHKRAITQIKALGYPIDRFEFELHKQFKRIFLKRM